MPSIVVRHLIYTRVEPEYSPAHRNGFQTVYFSPEIKSDVSFIERCVQCFVPTEEHVQQGIAEYQYFWTESGSAVIVQTLPIEADPKVIDSALGRRGGHFVSHALAISREQFARAGNDPFAVIIGAANAGVFTEDVPMLVSYLREAPPPAQINLKRRATLDDFPEEWSSSLEKWAAAAQSAGELTSKKNSLLLLSDDSEKVYALLSAALYLMDAERRIGCTFNTYVDGCVPAAGAYWAVGARKRISQSGFTAIDLASGAPEMKLASNDPKASPYSAWLRPTLQNYAGISVGMPEIYAAQIAAECLAAKRALPSDEPLSETALTTFREVNLERYQAGLMKGLTEALGKPISEALAPALVKLVGIRAVVDMGTLETDNPETLAPVVYQWTLNNAANIKAWNDLLKFAQAAPFDPLIVLAGAKAPSNFLTGNKAAAARTAALEHLAQKGELSAWLSGLRSALDIEDLVIPTSASIVSRETDLDALDDATFARFAVAVLKADPAAIDSRFSSRVRKVGDKHHLKELAKLVKKSGSVTSAFAQAVQEAL